MGQAQNQVAQQFIDHKGRYWACIQELLNGLSVAEQQNVFNVLLNCYTDEEQATMKTNGKPGEDCRNHFFNQLYSYCVNGVLPEYTVLKAIFDVRKNAGKDAKDDAELLALFLYEQLSFLRKLPKPIYDGEKSQIKNAVVLRAITRADMKAFIDHTIAVTGIADEHKATVYQKINDLMRAEDDKIMQARTQKSLERSGKIHSSVVDNFNTLKSELVSANPDDIEIAIHLEKLANYDITMSSDAETIINKAIANLTTIIWELHDEPFMQDNGFARAKLYHAMIDILQRLDKYALDEQIAAEQKALGTGWFDDIFARFSIWSGYRRYTQAKSWSRNGHLSMDRLIRKIDAEGEAHLKNKNNPYPTSSKTVRQSFLALHSARVAKDRNRHVNKLRPTLLALGSMTSLSFAIMALLGVTGAAFFGLVLFSNPFVLPSIVIAFAAFSLIRTLYHLSNNAKLELDREINLEHDSMVYNDYENNPNTYVEKPSTWPAVSWVRKQANRLENHLTQNIQNKFAIYAIKVVVRLFSVPALIIAAMPDLVYKLGLKIKQDHNNMAKDVVNYIPILCVLIAVGFVLNHFLPGFFDFATNFNVSDTLTPGTHNKAQSFFASMLPMMAFGAVSGLGGKLLRWGWTNDSRAVTFFGNVLSRTGASLTKIAFALGAVSALRFFLPVIPPLPAAVVGIALSLTALVVVFTWSVCAELYTNFIDTRRSNKSQNTDQLEVEPGLYAVPTPTAYTKFEKKDQMTEMMTPMLDMLPGRKPKQPDADINIYYKVPSPAPEAR